jgi:hypothetical protein
VKNLTDRDDLTGVLRDLDIRLGRQERHSHHGVGPLEGTAGMLISGDHNNASHLGDDNGMYTREICVKATPPTPYDFGGRLVPGSIWVGVGVAEPEPEPTCVPWSDDFERTDLGADWVLGPASSDDEESHIFSIDSGAAVGVWDTNMTAPTEIATMRRSAPEESQSQFVEIQITDVWQPISSPCSTVAGFANQTEIWTHLDPTTGRRRGLYIGWFCNGTPTYVGIDLSTIEYSGPTEWDWSGDDDSIGVFPTTGQWGNTWTVRLESDADGAGRVYLDGVLQYSMTFDATINGDYIGVYHHWYAHGHITPTTTHSARFLSVSGGCLEA